VRNSEALKYDDRKPCRSGLQETAPGPDAENGHGPRSERHNLIDN
jgi:hypothetical protein